MNSGIETIAPSSPAFRVTLTVRNNLLLRCIERAGFSSIPKFAEAAGVKYGYVNDFISLKSAPINKDGTWRLAAVKLAEFLGVSPVELFDPSQYVPLERNKTYFEIEAEEAHHLLMQSHAAIAALPAYIPAEQNEFAKAVADQLHLLTPREEKVIRLRFGIGCDEMTLSDVAQVFELTTERIRQIEDKALRKLRHPGRNEKLLEAYTGDAIDYVPMEEENAKRKELSIKKLTNPTVDHVEPPARALTWGEARQAWDRLKTIRET